VCVAVLNNQKSCYEFKKNAVKYKHTFMPDCLTSDDYAIWPHAAIIKWQNIK